MGDIDLYIETEQKDRLYEKRIKYLARVNILLGVQKIDIIIANSSIS